MINRTVLVGRLTKDPELRYTPAGLAVARFTVAVNRNFSNQEGEREADFITCVAWRKQAENLANFTRKGHLIGIDGRIQTGSYEGNDGKRVYTTEVVADSIQFLEPRGNGQGQQANPGQQTQQQPYQTTSQQQGYQQQGYQQSPQEQWNGQPQFAGGGNGQYSFGQPPISVKDDDLPF